MESQQDIITIFSVLHDGTIESWKGNEDKLILKVSCLYLAELIEKDFEYFYVEIKNIHKIEFFAWMNTMDQEQLVFNKLEDIFKADFEILSADKEDNDAVINCNQYDTDLEYSGGNLILNCNEIKVFDQHYNHLPIDTLNQICNQYWNNIRNK